MKNNFLTAEIYLTVYNSSNIYLTSGVQSLRSFKSLGLNWTNQLLKIVRLEGLGVFELGLSVKLGEEQVPIPSQ